MRPVTTEELLDVWEQGAGRTRPEKALLLLDAACDDGQPQDPALLSIGERDTRLLQLREWMLESQLQNIADCPSCGERLEWINNTGDLRYPNDRERAPVPFELEVEEYSVKFRLPNSYDLSKASSGLKYEQDARKLLTDCILSAHNGVDVCDPVELPHRVLDLLDEHMALEDPQANIMMNLSCPACAHGWETQFDIVSYLWMEIDNWAGHVLQDIAALAFAFGWSESQILALSPQRRRLYLDIIRQ